MGTLHHHLMEVHVAVEDLRRALITMIALETTRKGITNVDILKFILTISMLIIMDRIHGSEKLVIFLVYITMSLLSVGKEWKHNEG